MDICEKVSYIKGLADGLKLDDSTNEGKVLLAVLDLLDDIVDEICDIEDGCDDICEQLNVVDEDLSAVEDIVYDACDCDDCDCGCEDDDVYEVTCPNCNDTIYLDEEMLEEDGIKCPNCGTDLEFDFDCDGECKSCDCEDCDIK